MYNNDLERVCNRWRSVDTVASTTVNRAVSAVDPTSPSDETKCCRSTTPPLRSPRWSRAIFHRRRWWPPPHRRRAASATTRHSTTTSSRRATRWRRSAVNCPSALRNQRHPRLRHRRRTRTTGKQCHLCTTTTVTRTWSIRFWSVYSFILLNK